MPGLARRGGLLPDSLAGRMVVTIFDAVQQTARSKGWFAASSVIGKTLREDRKLHSRDRRYVGDTVHAGEPLNEQKTKLVRRYVLKIEKHAFGHVVIVEAQAKRCVPLTLRFGESEVEGKCAQVLTLPPPLMTEFNRTADRLEQLFSIP